jgi:hypothetical protein
MPPINPPKTTRRRISSAPASPLREAGFLAALTSYAAKNFGGRGTGRGPRFFPTAKLFTAEHVEYFVTADEKAVLCLNSDV